MISPDIHDDATGAAFLRDAHAVKATTVSPFAHH
jgi:hypothetical protein